MSHACICVVYGVRGMQCHASIGMRVMHLYTRRIKAAADSSHFVRVCAWRDCILHSMFMLGTYDVKPVTTGTV